jgi:hypothetical protein
MIARHARKPSFLTWLRILMAALRCGTPDEFE